MNKIIVIQVRVSRANAIDFLELAGRKLQPGIKTEGAGDEALPAEHFVNAGDAAGKIIGSIEERGIAVRHLSRASQQLRRNDACGPGVSAFGQ